MTVNELAVACKTDRRNIEALWLAVYRLIVLWARRYCKQHDNRYSLDDLTQSAYFALIKAVDDYTLDCGYQFTTYLHKRCMTEFATVLGIRTSKLEPPTASLDAPLNADTDLTLADTLPDAQAAADMDNVIEGVYNKQLHTALDLAMQTLPEAQRNVLDMRFYKGLTLKDTAARLDYKSFERIRQLEVEALRTLRRGKAYAALKSFDYRGQGLKRTGYTYFKYNRESSVEAAAIKLLELDGRYQKLVEEWRSTN